MTITLPLDPSTAIVAAHQHADAGRSLAALRCLTNVADILVAGDRNGAGDRKVLPATTQDGEYGRTIAAAFLDAVRLRNLPEALRAGEALAILRYSQLPTSRTGDWE